MKWLADANVEVAIVEWLRTCNHDVLWAAEMSPSTPDSCLLATAKEEERILLTHDRDFGEMVFRRKLVGHGVILMRFSAALQFRPVSTRNSIRASE